MKSRVLSFSRLTATLAMLVLVGAGLGHQFDHGDGAKICVGAANKTTCVPPK